MELFTDIGKNIGEGFYHRNKYNFNTSRERTREKNGIFIQTRTNHNL
jgi:hypothetical protein